MGVSKKKQRQVCDFLFSPEAKSQEKKNRTHREEKFSTRGLSSEDGKGEREREEKEIQGKSERQGEKYSKGWRERERTE